jgi:UDP-2,3-diacylglucosamine hydrolase
VTPTVAPAPADWRAPPHWQAIDFVSDLHLSPALPNTTRAFIEYLRDTTADGVFLLGDVFEAWVGDDSRHQPFERAVVEAMAGVAARGRVLAFLPGNRDFLVGDDLCQAASMLRLPDPTRLLAWGQAWMLTLGDAQCLSDEAYQSFRRTVRSPEWTRGFLARPLADRLELARAMRQASMERRSQPVEGTGDLDTQACMELLARGEAATLVHGHTHRPAQHALGEARMRWVLSDWDLDGPGPARSEVLRLTRDGRLTRMAPAAACTAR